MSYTTDSRPDILVVMVDDMGFSDIGCFGAEIATPHLDRLAGDGLRMSAFYNCARCCPTRAALLTGVHPHQAGIGQMTKDGGTRAYQGYLRDDVMTTAEVLQAQGYATWMSGKWHVGGDYAVHLRQQWQAAGDATHPLPTQRGFDRYYGTLCGAGSYFQPPCCLDQDRFIDDFPEDYYYTDAVSDRAVDFIDEACAAGRRFYGYVAYTAPHWPLHAREEDIAAYRGRYAAGWDVLREERLARLREMGLLDAGWQLSPRDEDSRPWDTAPNQAWEAERMAVYAAQITAMDRGIGRIVAALERHGRQDNILIVFLSDNGGCAEFLREDGEPGRWPEMYALPTNRGTMAVVGNGPGRMPGPAETFMSYGLPWANASNTPFRKFKAWTNEGGISTPFVVRWAAGGIAGGRISHGSGHVIDLAATIEAAVGATRPATRNGQPMQALEGRDLLPLWRGHQDDVWGEAPMCWEHIGHSAVRRGPWKIVRARRDEAWQLYDMRTDRTELQDLAATHPELVTALATDYQAWAERVEVMS